MEIILIIFLYQLFFSISDIMGRKNMKLSGKSYLYLIAKPWIINYLLLRIIAISLMLYVFYNMYVGRAIVCSSGLSLLISAIIGSLYLKEKISKKYLLALMLIIIAVFLQGWR